MADFLDRNIGNFYAINFLVGLLSAVVDNVPLIAAKMHMYNMVYPTAHSFWEFLAHCTGTGGSVLSIGSAAGVAVMGMEKINFMWYLKKISAHALIGYISGALVFFVQKQFSGEVDAAPMARELQVKEPPVLKATTGDMSSAH